MDVVEQGPPRGIVVQIRAREAERALAVLGQKRQAPGIGLAEPHAPRRETVADDVAIEELIGVSAAVVATPAVGVQVRDGVPVGGGRESEAQRGQTTLARAADAFEGPRGSAEELRLARLFASRLERLLVH